MNKRFNEIFDIKVPQGIFFYPCCGKDTYKPIELFLDTIKEFHFVDINRIGLPKLQCGINGYSNRKCTIRDIPEEITTEIVKSAVSVPIRNKRNLGESFKHNLKVDFGDVMLVDSGDKETWETTIENNKSVEVYGHKLDGALSLMFMDRISVFFYRKDSPGEGGSGQWWLGTDLFNMVLDKLVEGGIIITDGSNFHSDYKDVPWKALRERNEVESFEYRDRKFVSVGRLEDGFRTAWVWKVDRVKQKIFVNSGLENSSLEREL